MHYRLAAFFLIVFCATAVASGEPISKIQVAGAIVPNVELRKARQAYLRNDFEACMQHLHQALKQQPNLPPPDLMFARLMLIYGNQQGRLLMEQVARAHSSSPEVYLTFADLALNEGRVTEAALHLERADECDRPEGWKSAHAKAFANAVILRRVVIAESRRDWDGAVKLIDQLIQAEPKRYDLRVRRARVAVSKGEDAEAEKILTAAESLDGGLPVNLVMARMLVSARRVKDAEARLATQLRESPSDPRAYVELAVLAMRKDEIQTARRRLASARSRGDRSASTRRIAALLERMDGKYEDAAVAFRELLSQYPTDSELKANLALVLDRSAKPADRERALKMAAEIAAEQPSGLSLAAFGWIKHRQGEFEEAHELLQSALAEPRLETLYFWARHLAETRDADAATTVKELRNQLAKSKGQLFILRGECRTWLRTQP